MMSVSFEQWKFNLRNDCERQGKIQQYSSLGDYVLELLWERGLDPTVQAIVDDAPKAA